MATDENEQTYSGAEKNAEAAESAPEAPPQHSAHENPNEPDVRPREASAGKSDGQGVSEPAQAYRASQSKEAESNAGPSRDSGTSTEGRAFAPASAQPAEQVGRPREPASDREHSNVSSTRTAPGPEASAGTLFTAEGMSDQERAQQIHLDFLKGSRVSNTMVGKNPKGTNEAKEREQAQKQNTSAAEASEKESRAASPSPQATAGSGTSPTKQLDPEESAADALPPAEQQQARRAIDAMEKLGTWQDLDNRHSSLLDGGAAPGSEKVAEVSRQKAELGDPKNLEHDARAKWQKLNPHQKQFAQEQLSDKAKSAQKSLGIDPARGQWNAVSQTESQTESKGEKAGKNLTPSPSLSGQTDKGTRTRDKNLVQSTASLGSATVREGAESALNLRDSPGQAAIAALKTGKASLEFINEQVSRRMAAKLGRLIWGKVSSGKEKAPSPSVGKDEETSRPTPNDIGELKRQVSTYLKDHRRAVDSKARARVYSIKAINANKQLNRLKQRSDFKTPEIQRKANVLERKAERLQKQAGAIRKRMARPNYPSAEKAAKGLARTMGRFDRAFSMKASEALKQSTFTKHGGKKIAKTAGKVRKEGVRLLSSKSMGAAANLGKKTAQRGASMATGAVGTTINAGREAGKAVKDLASGENPGEGLGVGP